MIATAQGRHKIRVWRNGQIIGEYDDQHEAEAWSHWNSLPRRGGETGGVQRVRLSDEGVVLDELWLERA